MRVSSDKNHIRLVVTGSHNLSKAAWGCEEKGGTQVHIRSYEERIVIKVNPTKVGLFQLWTLFSLDQVESSNGTYIMGHDTAQDSWVNSTDKVEKPLFKNSKKLEKSSLKKFATQHRRNIRYVDPFCYFKERSHMMVLFVIG